MLIVWSKGEILSKGLLFLGGLNNKGNILNGPKEEIEKEVEAVLRRFGEKGIMIGADCTIQGENISLDYIKTAVYAAHKYKRQ